MLNCCFSVIIALDSWNVASEIECSDFKLGAENYFCV
jgi:hypothetical protein